MVMCMVCKGTGMVQLSDFPTNTGGRMNERYIFSGIKCGACGGSGREGTTAPEPQSGGTFGQQLSTQAELLIGRLQRSRFVPGAYRSAWQVTTRQLTTGPTSERRNAIISMRGEFERVAENNQAHRDVFNLAASETMQYDYEMRTIRDNMESIQQLIEQVFELENLYKS